MSKFAFETDGMSEAYCDAIVEEMVNTFAISKEEAISRINQKWVGMSLVGENDMIYHDLPHDWGMLIYYGHDSYWWIQGAERESLNLPPLQAKPAPE